jgi:hypothetical protein
VSSIDDAFLYYSEVWDSKLTRPSAGGTRSEQSALGETMSEAETADMVEGRGIPAPEPKKHSQL